MAHPQVEQQAARNAAIVTLALEQLRQLLGRVDWASPDALSAVQLIYRSVVTRFGRASAAVAAEFYDQVRAEHQIRQEFRAAPAAPLPDVVTDSTVASAFKGVRVTESDDVDSGDHVLVTEGTEDGADGQVRITETTSELPVDQRVPGRLEQSLSRHVLQPGRDTIAANTAEDPAEPTWIRVPTGETTCEFCIMLASRELGGYSSRENALFRENGEKYHKNCDCVAMPVYPGDYPHEISPNMARYQRLYYKATANAGTHSDTKKILAELRRQIKTEEPTPTPTASDRRSIRRRRRRRSVRARDERPSPATQTGGGGERTPPPPPRDNPPIAQEDDDPRRRLDRLFAEQTDGATEPQRRSVRRWQGKDGRFYEQVQQAIEGSADNAEAADVANDLDELMMPLPEDVVVWRGLRDAAVAFGVSELESIIGQPFEQQRLTATSLSREVAEQEFTRPGRSPVLCRVTARAGSPAVWIPPLGEPENAYQLEVLFAAGVILRILSVDRSTPVPVVEMEVTSGDG